MRFPLAGWAWPPGPRVSAAHNSGVDGRRDGREKGPMQATSGPQRDKTLPARPARRPTRYKTLPASTKTPISAHFSHAGRALSRMQSRFRYKTLPASPKTPISAHLSHAGRTLYRFRHQLPEQGELYPACGATSGTKLSQQAALAGPPGTKLSQHARLDGPPGTKLSLPPGSATHPVQNSPSERPWQAHPVQNSPSEPQNADFGPFFACRENFLPLPPPTRRAGRKKSRTNTPPHPNNVPLSKFRMQFDCVSFQQSPETLQSQRSQFKSQNTPRGIACEIDEAGFERAGGSGGHGRAPEKPAAVSAGSGRAKTEQKSHIISCGHFSRPPTNGAIATIQIHGLKHAQGNYVRNC